MKRISIVLLFLLTLSCSSLSTMTSTANADLIEHELPKEERPNAVEQEIHIANTTIPTEQVALAQESAALTTQDVLEQKTEPTIIPAKKVGTSVIVEHFGDDELGETLALKLKENLRKSILFNLANKNQKSIIIKIRSQNEFNERPEIGSVYSVVWTFTENEHVIPYYLEGKVGAESIKNIESLASKLMNMTDQIASEYKYLFE